MDVQLITHNPTRTRKIEQSWMREIKRRWSLFNRVAVTRLIEMNRGDLFMNEAGGVPFQLSPSQQRAYMVYLQREIQRLLIVTTSEPNWQAAYQLSAYQRGLENTRQILIASGQPIMPTIDEAIAGAGAGPFTATPALATAPTLAAGAPGAAIHRESLEFLYTRSYTDLVGWTDKMANQTRQILFDGFQQGEGIRDVVRKMERRIEVSRSRAETIARTETNQAYSKAAIAEADRASDELDEEIKVRWLTAADNRVRHAHARVHGVVMTTERARGIKTTDGINCRCALAPVVPGTNTAKKQAKFKKERSVLLSIDRK